MITPEERQSIIDEITERQLLVLPELVGIMMNQRIAKEKLKAAFFKDHPNFVPRLDLVQACIMETEGKNPGKSYDEILKLATPVIEARLGQARGLDMTSADKPKDLNYMGNL